MNQNVWITFASIHNFPDNKSVKMMRWPHSFGWEGHFQFQIWLIIFGHEPICISWKYQNVPFEGVEMLGRPTVYIYKLHRHSNRTAKKSDAVQICLTAMFDAIIPVFHVKRLGIQNAWKKNMQIIHIRREATQSELK